jgi:uncharacterized protein
VIAVDTNILVYAHRNDSPRHAEALAAVKSLSEAGETWAIPWHCAHEFLCVVTHPGIYKPPTSLASACQFLDSLFSSPHLRLLTEGPDYFATFKKHVIPAAVRGPLIYDARIAALCLFHEVTELWTADRDFSKFPQLKTHCPISRK